jgi:hypothetical protein
VLARGEERGKIDLLCLCVESARLPTLALHLLTLSDNSTSWNSPAEVGASAQSACGTIQPQLDPPRSSPTSIMLFVGTLSILLLAFDVWHAVNYFDASDGEGMVVAVGMPKTSSTSYFTERVSSTNRWSR